MIKLTVIIVSWNTCALLRLCLQSLLNDVASSGLVTQIIVVDSASADGSPAMVRAEFPAVDLITCAENIGFVKANNLALRQVLADDGRRKTDDGLPNTLHAPRSTPPTPHYTWLLNPDTVVQPGTLKTLIAFMDMHPKCGLCGPQLRNPDGSLQHGAFALPGLMQLWIDVIPRLQARWRNTHWDGRYPPERYASGQPFQIGTPLGAAMLARVEAVQQVGLLDEGFEMYSEEIDWAARMHQAQWEVWCVPAAIVIHYGGASSSQASARTERLKWRSRTRYFKKHYSAFKYWLAMRWVPRQQTPDKG